MNAAFGRLRSRLWRYGERRIDRLPKAVQLRASEYGRTVRSALEILLPEYSAPQREAILCGVVRYRFLNRGIQILHTSAPRLAGAAVRFIPAEASPSVRAAMRDVTAPLLILSAHFGPLFLQALALRRFVHGRRVIIVLGEQALYLHKIVPFVRRLGYEPVLADRHLLTNLRRALRDDPRTAVMIAFDDMHRGRRVVPFLGSAIATTNAIGLLADIGGARAVSSFWEWSDGRPRLVLAGPYAVDRTLPPGERRRRFLDQFYAILEAKVAAFPEQWSGWQYVMSSVSDVPLRRAAS
ncbi:MAG: hypothetical protein M3R53_10325 [Candidatus Eremiobacteraeota bacterium]|nr:hypothetical protein [Candidatus Eremiobacteraeota bacterium]